MSTDDWRSDLIGAVERGIAQDGLDPVGEALHAALGTLSDHPDAEVEPWCPPVPILGAVECGSGSLGVLLNTDGRVSVHLAATYDALVEQVQTSAEQGFVVAEADGSTDVPTRDELYRAGIVAPGWYSGSGFTEEDLLRACGVLLTAPR